jgi:hypothetical protein
MREAAANSFPAMNGTGFRASDQTAIRHDGGRLTA